MSYRFEEVKQQLMAQPKRWLITGVAGFIGSNLLEFLLKANQHVVGLDNFSTGFQQNLDEVKSQVSEVQWKRFSFLEGDLCSPSDCSMVCEGVDYVLQQAALGSVPRSIDNPVLTNASNITGFLNLLVSARDAAVESFTYAASSSTYGDHPALPKVENVIGRPLSPYAVTKYVNELYAEVFSRVYNFNCIGLRYFNVFGPRQNPNGAYAAVIPRWISSMLKDEEVVINGNGETSRDFCFINNVIQANILAAVAPKVARNQIYNVALNERTSLNELFDYLKKSLNSKGIIYSKKPNYRDERKGDVKHSQADIAKAREHLGYDPKFQIWAGLEVAMPWYLKQEQAVAIISQKELMT